MTGLTVAAARDAFHMKDGDLAKLLMKLSDEVRSNTSRFHMHFSEDENEMIKRLGSDLLPEIATRLCATDDITILSSRRSTFDNLPDEELRRQTADILCNSALQIKWNAFLDLDGSNISARMLNLLFSVVSNGNIVAIALDRLTPPANSSSDRLSRILSTVSSLRGKPGQCIWSPEICISNITFGTTAAGGIEYISA